MGEIRLYAFDLLKQNNSVARNTYDTYLEDTQTNVLQQYFMVNFIYNLRKFGAGMSNPPAGPERIHGGR